jgi:hypothetical protein
VSIRKNNKGERNVDKKKLIIENIWIESFILRSVDFFMNINKILFF